MAGRIVVGTSSWADPGFIAEWYPRELPAGRRLSWYAERFEGVELNASFYAVPELGTVERWAAQTPPGFTFDVKLHRLLSRHATQLEQLPPDLRPSARTNERGRVELTPELEAAVAARVREAVAPLARRQAQRASAAAHARVLAARNELDELEPLLGALAPLPVAVELRHRGWVQDPDAAERTLDWLADHDAAFVCVDAPAGDDMTIMPALDAATRDDVAYLRAHGRSRDNYLTGRTVAERFAYTYDDGELEEIAGRARPWRSRPGSCA